MKHSPIPPTLFQLKLVRKAIDDFIDDEGSEIDQSSPAASFYAQNLGECRLVAFASSPSCTKAWGSSELTDPGFEFDVQPGIAIPLYAVYSFCNNFPIVVNWILLVPS